MYAANSDKTLISVTPTIHNNSGYVREWHIEVEYSFPASGYSTVSTAYTSIVDTTVGVSTYNLAPTGFTSTGLLDLVTTRLDYLFDYKYELVHDIHDNAQTAQVGFGISQLSA